MKKIYFLLIFVVCTTFIFAQKNLGLQNSLNFRELGGLKNKNGQTFKYGLMYRSGSFSKLSEEEGIVLKNTGINTVIDFRNEHEISKEPDFFPDDMQVQMINSPIGNLSEKGMSAFQNVFSKPDFKPQDLDSLMINIYIGFVDNISDFKPVFEQSLSEESIILFHCSAGKDRTGFTSSLLLYALDFEWVTIMDDFLRSNEAVNEQSIEKIKNYGLPIEIANQLMGVKPIYLEAAWKRIEQKYGKADIMLETALGIGSKEKEMLKKKYLE